MTRTPTRSARSARLAMVATLVAVVVPLAGCALPPSPSTAPSTSPSTSRAGLPASNATAARLTTAGQAVLGSGATAFVGTVHGAHDTSVALGVAERGTRHKAGAGDEFQMGSTTKTVTATVVLQLVGEGRLSLDDTVEHWLPGAVPDGKNITVRMLLQHTSGLFDYTADDHFARALLDHPTRRSTPNELLAVALSHRPTFAPGKGWAYSSTGYVVAGMIVQAVTGEPVAHLITERIIDRLGLHHTYWAADGLFHGHHLHGYYRTRPDGSTYVDVSPYPVSWGDAAGGLVSTADDLGRFERALQSGLLLAPAQLAEMRTTVDVPGTGGQYAYGLGLMRITTPGGYVWGHTGGTLGYLTQAWASEDGTRSIVENVPTGASTPAGPDHAIDSSATAAASSLFDLLTA